MKVFYIDTTSSYLYTGIVADNVLLASKELFLSHELSSFTLFEVASMFDDVHLTPNDIDKIIVVNGPGSFTGIRIGVSLAKIYAYCLHKDITVISSLEAMAVGNDNGLSVPLIDAKRGYCYAAVYDNETVLLEEGYLSLDELKDFLKKLNKPYTYITNDKLALETKEYHPDILKIVQKFQNREGVNPHFVNPKYLKLTLAEENRMKA